MAASRPPSTPVDEVRRIAAQLADAIRGGRYQPGQRLPTLRSLAARHRTSYNAARDAFQLLQAQGLVACRHGSGTYVLGEESRSELQADSAAIDPTSAVLLINPREHVYDRLHAELIDRLQDLGMTSSTVVWRQDRDLSQFDDLFTRWRRSAPAVVVVAFADAALDLALERHRHPGTHVIAAMRLARMAAPLTWDSVQPDVSAAARMAALHLVARGHRRLGLIVHTRAPRHGQPMPPKAEVGHTQDILEIGRCLRDVGLPRGALTLHYTTITGRNARGDATGAVMAEPNIESLEAWLTQPGRPTAVISEDFRLRAVTRAAANVGLRIGHDLELMGLGNTPWAEAGGWNSVDYRPETVARRIVRLVRQRRQPAASVRVRRLVVTPRLARHAKPAPTSLDSGAQSRF